MFFKVLPVGTQPPAQGESQGFLLADNWNDWYTYATQYKLVVFDSAGQQYYIGEIKIGQFNMPKGQARPAIGSDFEELDERFFSLGQDDAYYENLNNLGAEIRDKVLRSLRDMAWDLDLFSRAQAEDVTGESILRSVMPSTVQGQFHRLAHGGARLSRYEFVYTASAPPPGIEPVSLSFVVEPESSPPTNIHVIIGRNGVGKTRLLNHMMRALLEDGQNEREFGKFSSIESNPFNIQMFGSNISRNQQFANLVSVTFSAFDPFSPLPKHKNALSGVQYSYIGLKEEIQSASENTGTLKNHEVLSKEFGRSIHSCRKGSRLSRWRNALETLEGDPIFKDAEIADLASDSILDGDLELKACALFDRLSSGHKIVLLTITRLVETVEERSLVLLDEPEAHLHPPLLSAFVRALSDLLINRNGVAIIATHSPVVLQEVPKSCVWMMRRVGQRVSIDRPEYETFGENVGTLTREVFGLEVTHSGFHKMLADAVKSDRSYEAIVRQFGGALGGEARALVRALIAAKEAEDNL